MAKKSAVEKNKARLIKVKKFSVKRKKLKEIIMNKNTSQEDRFQAVIKLEIGANFRVDLEAFTEESSYLGLL